MKSKTAPLLFAGALLTAAGYGATFLLTEHFRSLGGSELDTGRTLGGAVVGTLIGVPLVGWTSGRFGGARLAAMGAVLVGLGYMMLALLSVMGPLIPLAGGLIGLGWGMFYLAAPMAVSERVSDADRGFWFTRFGVFQMAGIGGSPVLALFLANHLQLATPAIFQMLAVVCAIAALCLWAFEAADPRPPRAMVKPQNWLTSLAPVARTPAIYPILMVGLGASVFTGMMTFQSSLLRGTNLSAGLYFAVYAGVVVVSRFVLAPVISKADNNRMSVLLLAIMVAGVCAMFGIAGGVVVQAVSAVLLGLGYGLVYTVIQTQVVNDAPPEHRTGALTWFVVSYFVGIFGFPVIGGWLIVWAGARAFLAVVLACALAELGLSLLRQRRV